MQAALDDRCRIGSKNARANVCNADKYEPPPTESGRLLFADQSIVHVREKGIGGSEGRRRVASLPLTFLTRSRSFPDRVAAGAKKILRTGSPVYFLFLPTISAACVFVRETINRWHSPDREKRRTQDKGPAQKSSFPRSYYGDDQAGFHLTEWR